MHTPTHLFWKRTSLCKINFEAESYAEIVCVKTKGNMWLNEINVSKWKFSWVLNRSLMMIIMMTMMMEMSHTPLIRLSLYLMQPWANHISFACKCNRDRQWQDDDDARYDYAGETFMVDMMKMLVIIIFELWVCLFDDDENLFLWILVKVCVFEGELACVTLLMIVNQDLADRIDVNPRSSGRCKSQLLVCFECYSN